MSEPSYDEIPYEGRPVPATAPAAMALTAMAHGGPRAPLGSARVLELGCGDGANLLPLAFFHPSWQLTGVDTSSVAIDAARRRAAELELSNVRFVQGDLAALELAEEQDFVIAHGIYSWVDAGTREALRALVGRVLSPSGLAYVSFNAQPGWGVRGRVRDALIRAPMTGTASERVTRARERAGGLVDILGEPQNDWALLLSHELSRAADAGDDYLAHEYLARDNVAFWLGDVVRDFAGVGLRYVGDATFDRPEGWVPPTLRERASALTEDPIAVEELVDLLAYRQLRAAVFCREHAERSPAADLLDEASIASAVRNAHDPFDPMPGVEEPFVGPRGTEVRVTAPLAKMALLLLASSYPRAMRFDTLVEAASAHLERYGISPEPDEASRLRAGLRSLFDRLELELRLEDAPLRTEPGPRPLASALSRQEAADRTLLTTPIHSTLPLDPVDRAIVLRLDGTRSADSVVDDLTEALSTGALELEGAPANAARARPFLAQRVTQTITTLGWWGLVR